MSRTVKWQADGHTGIITLNRPEQLNALNQTVLHQLEEVVDGDADSEEIRAVILTGAGDRAFVAGADLNSMKDMNKQQAYEWSMLGQRVFGKIAQLSQPTIAAVGGFALGGGCELALACDLRLASEEAVLGQPEVTLGIPPGFGATYRLPRAVGPALARELILTGRKVNAEEALRMGLVSEVVPDTELMDRAMELAEEMSTYGPTAMKHAKLALDGALHAAPEEARELEARLFAETFPTGEPKEGMTAFLQKRRADF